MHIVFLGPPGAGKGTMAVRLAEHARIKHISTGDIFRHHIRTKTELGLRVQGILDEGGLVPDDLTTELIAHTLEAEEAQRGYILDGFPRTVVQAVSLEKIARIERVFYFSLSEERIVERLSGRRVHPASGRLYHVKYKPPKEAGKDDHTGEPLIIRPDDSEDAIRNRLKTYNEQTAPLVNFYRERGVLTTLDASHRPDEVFENLTHALRTP